MIEPTAGVLDGKTHLLPVRVYYEDTDFTGVVYHANYLRYFERGRSDFLRLAGVSHTHLLAQAQPSAFAITEMAIAFKRAARVDDALVVRTEARGVKGVRLFFDQQVRRGEELIASAAVEAVCITPDGRLLRPPTELVARIKPLFTLNEALS
jgi:acyl-CoA thioester hydrolase